MNIKANILIFSVFDQSRTNNENLDNHSKVIERLNALKISYKVLDGVYYGSKEKSILLHDTQANRSTVEIILKWFNQDCYLESGSDRTSSLVYPDHKEYLGVLREIDKEMASQLDSYSFDPSSNTYWAVS